MEEGRQRRKRRPSPRLGLPLPALCGPSVSGEMWEPKPQISWEELKSWMFLHIPSCDGKRLKNPRDVPDSMEPAYGDKTQGPILLCE